MPLTKSYFIPHSPLLIPNIGKDYKNLLQETLHALNSVQSTLEKDIPESIIVLSAHTKLNTATININLADTYHANLQDFGDLVSDKEWYPDIEIINLIRDKAQHLYDINLVTDEKLNYGAAIPLICLTSNLPDIKIIPISFAKLPLPEMYRFGQFLYEQCSTSHKKITCLATGDLSHRLSKESPSGYSPKSRAFDQQVVRAFKEKKLHSLTKLSDALLEHVGQCGIRSMLILGGMYADIQYNPTVLSYESPLGIGYLTAEMTLPL